jgi:adenosylhomocysteinase
MDDGCDLVSLLHGERPEQVGEVLAGTEETTTGVIRLRAMAADGALRFPVMAVNEAQTKHLFEQARGRAAARARGPRRRPFPSIADG